MRISNYTELIAHLDSIDTTANEDDEFGLMMEEYIKRRYPVIEHVNCVMKNDEKGIYTSFPNQEVMKDKFTIRVKRRNLMTLEHRHEYIEIVYVLEGQLVQEMNGEKQRMRKGDICILDKNVRHSSEALTEHDIVINMLITPDFFDGLFMNLLTDDNRISNFIINSLYSMSTAQQYIMYHAEENSIIRMILESMLMEYFSEKTRSMIAIKGYLLILFTELSRGLAEGKEEVIKKSLKSIKKELFDYIKENFKDCNLTVMAGHFHFHPVYLSNLIKREFGKNLKDLLMELRMEEVSHLLKNTDMTIENIINEVGYTNNSYFYKIFKKQYGCTPVDYRRNVGK